MGVIPGEESITDLVVFSLASIPGRVCRVHRVIRNDERKVGPDFVLWLVSSRNGALVGLPLLVQAKRLYPNGQFMALHAVSPTHPQMGVLMGVAAKWGLVPVYALYQPPGAAVDGVPGLLPTKCAVVNAPCTLAGDDVIHPASHPAAGCLPRDEADLGVTLVRADEVASVVGAGPPSIQVLGPLSVPFACLARCACLVPAATPDEPVGNPGPPPFAGNGTPGAFDDLVATAMSLLMSPDEIATTFLRGVPDWVAATLQDRDGTTIEQRNVAATDLRSDVGTVVVLTDADPNELE